MRPGDTFAPTRRSRWFTAAAGALLVLLAGGAVVGLMHATSAADDCPWPEVRNVAGRSEAGAARGESRHSSWSWSVSAGSPNMHACEARSVAIWSVAVCSMMLVTR